MLLIQQGDTTHDIPVLLTSSTDHTTGLTGATLATLLTATKASKNHGALSAAAGSYIEVGNGEYAYTPAAGEVDTFGRLTLSIVGYGGADPADVECQVVAFNPYAAANLGLTDLDATISSRLATSGYTAPDNADIASIKARTDNLPDDPADASVVAGLIAGIPAAPTAAAIQAYLDANSTRLAHLDADVSVGSLDLADGVETGITERQALRLILAALAGKVSGAGTTTITFRNVGDTKTRITATVDANGDRTAVTTDAT